MVKKAEPLDKVYPLIRVIKKRFDSSGWSGGYFVNTPYSWRKKPVKYKIDGHWFNAIAVKGYTNIDRNKFEHDYGKVKKFEGKTVTIVLEQYFEQFKDLITEVEQAAIA